MRGARYHGHARHTESPRPYRDHSRRTFHDLFCAVARVCAADRGIRTGKQDRFHEPAGTRAVRSLYVRHYCGHSDRAIDPQDGTARTEATVRAHVARVPPSQRTHGADAVARSSQGIPVSRRHCDLHCRCHRLGAGLLSPLGRHCSVCRGTTACGRSDIVGSGTRGGVIRNRQPGGGAATRAKLVGACRAFRRAHFCTARLGLARVLRGNRGLPGPRSRRGRAGHGIRGRRRGGRGDLVGSLEISPLARWQPGVHVADGVRLADFLRVLPAVRGDARRYPS